MNLNKMYELLDAFVESPGDRKNGEFLAEELGHELPRQDLQKVREFCAEASAASSRLSKQESPSSAFAQGFLRCLAIVCNAFDAESSALRYDEIRRRLASHPFRAAIIQSLQERPRHIDELMSVTKATRSAVLHALGHLMDLGFVDSMGTASAQGNDDTLFILGPRAYLLDPDSLRQADRQRLRFRQPYAAVYGPSQILDDLATEDDACRDFAREPGEQSVILDDD